MPMRNLERGDRVRFTWGKHVNQQGTIQRAERKAKVSIYLIRLDDGQEVRHRGRYGLSLIKEK